MREPQDNGPVAPVRSFWSGTLSFGLVSIPVDLYSAARPHAKSMRLVDKEGHPVGREYRCSEDGKKLAAEDLVRGYETESGKIVVITDEELESVAPEMSRDIELRAFVPREQIPALYYDRPYFLAPSGRSQKAYNLLARTMERTARVGIGRFVMRGHEYLTAIVSENGVLRAETLRHSTEIRTPEGIGRPSPAKPSSKLITRFVREIEELARDKLDMADFEDHDAHDLQELAQRKQERGEDVIEHLGQADDETDDGGSAQIIDLMQVLRRRLSGTTQLSTPESRPSTARGTTSGTRRARARGARKKPSRKRSAVHRP